MRVVRVTPRLIHRYLFCEIETDTGLVGLGESGAWAYLDASAAINRLGGYLTGKDPLRMDITGSTCTAPAISWGQIMGAQHRVAVGYCGQALWRARISTPGEAAEGRLFPYDGRNA